MGCSGGDEGSLRVSDQQALVLSLLYRVGEVPASRLVPLIRQLWPPDPLRSAGDANRLIADLATEDLLTETARSTVVPGDCRYSCSPTGFAAVRRWIDHFELNDASFAHPIFVRALALPILPIGHQLAWIERCRTKIVARLDASEALCRPLGIFGQDWECLSMCNHWQAGLDLCDQLKFELIKAASRSAADVDARI